jgi:hypothetical protein
MGTIGPLFGARDSYVVLQNLSLRLITHLNVWVVTETPEKPSMKYLITAAFIVAGVTLAVPASAHETSNGSMANHTMADGSTMKDSSMGAKPMKTKMKHKMHHSMSGSMSGHSMSGMKPNGN